MSIFYHLGVSLLEFYSYLESKGLWIEQLKCFLDNWLYFFFFFFFSVQAVRNPINLRLTGAKD